MKIIGTIDANRHRGDSTLFIVHNVILFFKEDSGKRFWLGIMELNFHDVWYVEDKSKRDL